MIFKEHHTKIIVTFMLYSLVIFINYLANALPIGGLTTGQVSDLLDNLFTPAGFTFSIWGVIYLGLLIFLISSIFTSNNQKPFLNKILNLFSITCILNISWIFAWHSSIPTWDFAWAV